MSINIKNAIIEFLKYTEKYDLEDENIQRKKEHSLRVMNISETIARKLNLSEEEIQLSTLIGLLHDIARFEQYKRYQTFKDSNSFDHGNYALKILNRDIRKYIEQDDYDEIIRKAIKNHNKFIIEDELTKKEELFAKIIRDADKIYILYESVELFWKGEEEVVEKSVISQEVFEAIQSNKLIKKQKNKNYEKIDSVVLIIAFIFDINFNVSFEIIKNGNYIDGILNRYNMRDEYTKNAIEEVRKIANNYIYNNQ